MAKLGNTGNTSGPHLRFHLMDGPSVLGSNGFPYVIDGFAVGGEISQKRFAAPKELEGDYSKGMAANESPRKAQFPMDWAIVDFPDNSGSKAATSARPLR